MKVYLETHSTDENWNPCAPILEVEITRGTLRRIKRACRELKRMNKESGPNVAEIHLYSSPVSNWGVGFCEDGEPFDYSNTPEGGGACLRTDLARIEVLDAFFLFSAWARGSDIRFNSGAIYFNDLEANAVPLWKR